VTTRICSDKRWISRSPLCRPTVLWLSKILTRLTRPAPKGHSPVRACCLAVAGSPKLYELRGPVPALGGPRPSAEAARDRIGALPVRRPCHPPVPARRRHPPECRKLNAPSLVVPPNLGLHTAKMIRCRSCLPLRPQCGHRPGSEYVDYHDASRNGPRQAARLLAVCLRARFLMHAAWPDLPREREPLELRPIAHAFFQQKRSPDASVLFLQPLAIVALGPVNLFMKFHCPHMTDITTAAIKESPN